MLTKSLAAPPEKHHGLTDPELRQRMRYLDLTYGEGVMPRFLNRTKIVRSIRDTLHARGFVEVEGPTLHSIAGGAAARPFKTHHNALDIDLYLRIALELHLKRCSWSAALQRALDHRQPGARRRPQRSEVGFRALVGRTVHAYLEDTRLGAAAHLLAGGATSVTEAALAAGYANPSDFAELFRRRHGVSPARWLRR